MDVELKFEVALQLARSLTTIDGFPRFEDAIMATAFDLQDWCRGCFLAGGFWSPERQAQWVVQEARLTWLKWASTADFRGLFQAKFQPKPEPANAFHPLGPALPIACRRCSDLGTVKGPDGYSVWCQCEHASKLRAETPGWLELVNRHLAPKEPGQRREEIPLTLERLDNLRREEKLIVNQALNGAEAMFHDPRATKEQKKTARKLMKLYGAKKEKP